MNTKLSRRDFLSTFASGITYMGVRTPDWYPRFTFLRRRMWVHAATCWSASSNAARWMASTSSSLTPNRITTKPAPRSPSPNRSRAKITPSLIWMASLVCTLTAPIQRNLGRQTTRAHSRRRFARPDSLALRRDGLHGTRHARRKTNSNRLVSPSFANSGLGK